MQGADAPVKGEEREKHQIKKIGRENKSEKEERTFVEIRLAEGAMNSRRTRTREASTSSKIATSVIQTG